MQGSVTDVLVSWLKETVYAPAHPNGIQRSRLGRIFPVRLRALFVDRPSGASLRGEQ